jgi:hypothetical protein
MSIFGNIMGAIFGQKTAQAAPGAQPSAAGAPSWPGANPAGTSGTAQSTVDVEAVLTEKAAKKGEKLNWRQSIVDLMKVLDLDSSLTARKSLAQELGYTGALDGSAEMNIWLHKQVMRKLAENGGKVPADLKS